MNTKLIIFDLDGVLIDSRQLHFDALNLALKEISEEFVISIEEHNKRFDGLPTNKKLEILSSERNLSKELHQTIWKNKQEKTFESIKNFVKRDQKLIDLFTSLKSLNIKICVASNSILHTIELILKQKEIYDLIDLIVSNEDVSFPKPNPQMYLKCMTAFGISPKDTIIVEDSFVGRQAAFDSGAVVCPVKNTTEVLFERILSYMNNKKDKMKWVNKNLNVLIPMAGEGSRFSKAGYTFPKPIIEVNGKPMIQLVVDNLNLDANYIYIIRKEHDEKFNISSMLKQITPGCKIVTVDSLTEGAACTTLLAKEFIDNDMELLIANSDQYVEWESGEFYHTINNPNIDGAILCFENTHPKWSYVKLNSDGNICEVREKEVISNLATIGIYYWSSGKDYVKYAEQMISKDIRYGQSFNGKGEFYVAPVYNEAFLDNKIVKSYSVEKMYGLGTPEDLETFVRTYESK